MPRAPVATAQPLPSYQATQRPAFETPVTRQSLPASETPTIEPYRPDMLPRPGGDDSLRARPASPPPVVPAEAPSASFGSQPLRREGGSSLRESILKKPLSSLYKRD